jgi:hypothetical protein
MGNVTIPLSFSMHCTTNFENCTALRLLSASVGSDDEAAGGSGGSARGHSKVDGESGKLIGRLKIVLLGAEGLRPLIAFLWL